MRPLFHPKAIDRDAALVELLHGEAAGAAETLGLSVTNAKTRVHRARLFLRHRLGESLR
jgi:DNA-directed RNA polymerase specialized sigma24 family protein